MAEDPAAASRTTADTGVAEIAEFVRLAIEHKSSDPTAYESIRAKLQDAIASNDNKALCRLLDSFSLCVSSMDRSCKSLVHATLNINWFCVNADVIHAFDEFVTSLVSANSLYAERVMSEIIRCFLGPGDASTPEDDIGSNGLATHDVIGSACEVLCEVLSIVPGQKRKLGQILGAKVPHIRCATSVHKQYIESILKFAALDPYALAPLVLPLVIEAIVKVDLETVDYGSENGSETCDDESSENLSDDETDQSMDGLDTQFEFDDEVVQDGANEVAVPDDPTETLESVEIETPQDEPDSHKLDALMTLAINFIVSITRADEKCAPHLFSILWDSFESAILPTYQTKHVQYLLFTVCSLDTSLPSEFVGRLLQKALEDGSSVLVRQTASAYISSFVARANYVDINCIRAALEELCGWLHDYLHEQANLGSNAAEGQQHVLFYAFCQAVFYILCFRLEGLMDTDGGATFVSTLNLNMIIKSSLCPLIVCQKVVVKEFARLTKLHQIVYCDQYMGKKSVVSMSLRRSSRPTPSTLEPAPQQLEDFFPFDPYLLSGSADVVEPLYRRWTGGGGEELESDSEDSGDGEDDFLEPSPMSTSSVSERSVADKGRDIPWSAKRRAEKSAGFSGTPISISLEKKRSKSNPVLSMNDEFDYLDGAPQG